MVFDIVLVNYDSNIYALPHIGKDAILKADGVFVLHEHARQASELAIEIVVEFFADGIKIIKNIRILIRLYMQKLFYSVYLSRWKIEQSSENVLTRKGVYIHICM